MRPAAGTASRRDPPAPRRWTVLSSRTLVDNPWIRVRRERCRTPRGHVVPAYYVVDKADFAMVAAFDARGRAVLVRQYKHGAGRVVTELPAGHVARGESPRRAARRELEEETGLRAARMVPLGVFHTSPATLSNRAHLFLARGLSAGTRRFDPSEDIAVVSLAPEQALRALEEACSVTCLTLARAHMDSRRRR